ncbi:MAG: Ku protein [Planctomycetes bacterium]|nr:Ku protein [Planctomycetota bacterium]
MAARSIWSGSISFGLVNIPVKLVTAVRDKQLRFHQISDSKKVRVRQKLVPEGTDREISRDDIVKGYEIAPEQYVVITDDELKALAAEKSRAIDIVDFVDLAQIDPIFYDQPYYVLPDERAGRAYWLLYEAMRDSGRVAIARFVMRNKEILAAVRPIEGGLCLETMHFHDEVIGQDAYGAAKPAKPTERELKVAEQIIASLTTEFDPTKYEDEYRKRVLAFIDKKAEGHVETIAEEPVQRQGKVLDLMAALEASLGQVKTQGKAQDRPSAKGEPARGERAKSRSARPHPRHDHAKHGRKVG